MLRNGPRLSRGLENELIMSGAPWTSSLCNAFSSPLLIWGETSNEKKCEKGRKVSLKRDCNGRRRIFLPSPTTYPQFCRARLRNLLVVSLYGSPTHFSCNGLPQRVWENPLKRRFLRACQRLLPSAWVAAPLCFWTSYSWFNLGGLCHSVKALALPGQLLHQCICNFCKKEETKSPKD